MIEADRPKYGVIGHPVHHSVSPMIYECFMALLGRPMAMEYIGLDPGRRGFLSAIRKFQEEGGQGLNITLPFKQEAFDAAQTSSERADQARAASLLQFGVDNTVYAENFDGVGLLRDLDRNYGIQLYQQRVLILGGGGAVRGILPALLSAHPAEIVVAHRNAVKLDRKMGMFAEEVRHINFESLHTDSPYSLIIHATSVGHTQGVLNLPMAIMGVDSFCYDLSYGRAALPFWEAIEFQKVAGYADGLGMLIEHNAMAFHSWFGLYPNTRLASETIRREMR